MTSKLLLIANALPAAVRLATPLVIALFVAGCFSSVMPEPPAQPGPGEPIAITISVKDDWGEGMGNVPVQVRTKTSTELARTNSNGVVTVGIEAFPVEIKPFGAGHVYNPPQITLTSSRRATFKTLHPIMGTATVTREQAKTWLRRELQRRGRSSADVSRYVALVDHYFDIAPIYGIRPEVALAQAAHETGYFGYGKLVKEWQHNFAGIGATGTASDGTTPLRGADPKQVRFEKGIHGAIFSTPAAGVEGHIQHLYAYATNKPLPAGSTLLSPRFNLVNPRGKSPYVEYLGAKKSEGRTGWAEDEEYGRKIIQNFLIPMRRAAGS